MVGSNAEARPHRPLELSAPVEAAHEGLKQAGVPEPMAGLYAEMYAGLAKGLVRWETTSQVRGATALVDALRPLV